MANLKKLHRLISCLSRNEKRYFKQQANIYSADKEQEYIVLFDLICQQKIFDLVALKEVIKSKQIINISIKSKYLYNAILDSLNNYNKRKYPCSQLADKLLQVTILQDRGLLLESLELVGKVKKQAYKFEMYDVLYLAIEKELEVIFIQNHGAFSKEYQQACEEREKIRIINQNARLYKQAASKIAAFEAKKSSLPFVLTDFLESFPFLTQEKFALSSNALSLHYRIWSTIHYLSQDYLLMLEVSKKAIDFTCHFPLRPNRILSLYQNYFVACNRLNSYKDFKYGLELIHNTNFPDKQHQAILLGLKSGATLSCWQLKPNYDSMILETLFDNFEANYQEIQDYMHSFRKKLWIFDLVAFSIQANNLIKFRIWLDRLLHLSDYYDFKQEEELVLKFFKMILYYEENIPLLMNREARAIGYFMNRRNLETPILMETKKNFQRLSKASSIDTKRKIFEKFIINLEGLDTSLTNSYWDLNFLKIWATLQYKSLLRG